MTHDAPGAAEAANSELITPGRRAPVPAYGGTWEDSRFGPLWVANGSSYPRTRSDLSRLEITPLDIAPALRFESWSLTPAGPSGRIEDELEPGERLIWSGRPRQGLHFGVANDIAVAVAVVFLLGWVGFAASIAVRNLAVGRAASQILIPSGMACVGLFFVAYILWLEPRGRGRTAYGLTDRRALIVSGQLKPTVESIPLQATATVRLKLNGDGSGCITFADYVRPCGEDECSPTFAGVEDARRVHGLVLAALPDWTALRS